MVVKDPRHDVKFAKICAWLKANKLTMHVPLKGTPVFRHKMESKSNASNS